MDESIRHHPALGELRWNEQLQYWETNVELTPGMPISLSLGVWRQGRNDASPDELFTLGAEYLAWARTAEARCRHKIADDLLSIYNENWACDDTDNADGGTGTIDRAGFLGRIRPSSIRLNGDGDAYWYYEDGDLFAGHWIEIGVSADRVFSEAGLAG